MLSAAYADVASPIDRGLLDRLVLGFKNQSDACRSMAALVRGLHERRTTMPATDWRHFIAATRAHRIATIIHQDPFTGWAFAKPRGYAGDAALLDFIYERREADVAMASRVGRAVYAYTKHLAAADAVRDRRDRLAALVDETAAARPGGIEVLTLAAGHLREARKSEAFRAGAVKRWVALDQDIESTARTADLFAGTSVTAFNGSVRNLLFGKYDLGQFDLIYAAGLYDYLGPGLAARLSEVCFRMLKPGGTFLFGNFAKGIEDDGYMETFMDWHLVFRSETEVRAILESCRDDAVAERHLTYGANRNIIYGALRKAR